MDENNNKLNCRECAVYLIYAYSDPGHETVYSSNSN